MRSFLLLAITLFSTYILHAQDAWDNSLLPAPQHVQLQDGRFLLSPGFSVSVNAAKTDTILFAAVNRMYQTLNRRTALYFDKQYITPADNSDTASLTITVQQSVNRQLGVDESYTLTVTPQNIHLTAATTTGALRGLQTLLQMVANNAGSYYLPAIAIKDEPRFAWRGLMIDVARHFIPLEVIKRNIDAMEAVKMNVLHLHLSDDEGFRIESKVFPLLQANGSNGDYYTQAEIKGLIAYAQQRGIMIVPEFDMPGHTTGFLSAYPQLGSAPGPYTPGPRFKNLGNKQQSLGDIMKMINTTPTPTFDPTKEYTYEFIDKFFGEMAALFPSPYIHVGADENNGVAWNNNPAITAFMQKNKIANTHDLQAYFVKRVQQIVAKHHKETSGWEELFAPDLPKTLLVQVWNDGSYFNKALAHGNNVIVSKGFYLDLFMPASVHYNNDAVPAHLPDSATGTFLGGEAAMWSEAVDRFNIEGRIWPRAAAIAERLWSPATVTDVDDMYRRLLDVSRQLDEAGLQHISNYERALRRFAGGKAITPVKTLTDVLATVKGYKKLFANMGRPANATYQTAPLGALSDVVLVDGDVKRMFRQAVAGYLKTRDSANTAVIESYLHCWIDNDAQLQGYFKQSPQLAAVQQHSKNLQVAATIGLEALDKMKAGVVPSTEWIKEKMNVLAACKKAYAEVELAILPEIEALLTQKLAPEPTSYPMF